MHGRSSRFVHAGAAAAPAPAAFPALVFAATFAAALAVALFAPLASAADAFPAKTVRIVHVYPGGVVDAVSRGLAERLSQMWKQPVVVDPKPGANELIAGDLVAKAEGDGHTLYIGTEATFANNPNLYGRMPFDPAVDLLPVSELFQIRFGLVVRGNLPVASVGEFVALMKTQGDRHTYASSGIGGPLHLAMEGFSATAGFRMVHAPYKVLPQVFQDLLGGSIDAVFLSVPPALPFAKKGSLKILAVTGTSRLERAPDIPTFAELGYDAVDYKTSIGLAVPGRTPPALIGRIQSDVAAVLHSKEFVEKFLVPNEIDAIGSEPGRFADVIAARRASAKRLIESLQIRLN